MRMVFTVDDERAFHRTRDELGARFGRWLKGQQVPGEAGDAELLMDWKFGYGDGDLAVWTVDDVTEFLMEWCPRKLSATPAQSRGIPGSVAAFVEFLAHTGMLGPASDPPSRIRRVAESRTRAFVREMGDPANYGMAKGLLGGMGLGALLGDTDPDVEIAADTEPDDEPFVVGPVRLPDDDERLAALRAAPAMHQLAELARYCAPPGRTLTAKGNLRLADACHLVEALDTGDELTSDGRALRSAEDLPTLTWLHRVALAAGVVRRQRDRLVAVARFAGLDEAVAHEKVVRATLDADPDASVPRLLSALQPLLASLDEFPVTALARLLDAGDDGVALSELMELAVELVEARYPGMGQLVVGVGPHRVLDRIDALGRLGVLTLTTPDEPCTNCGQVHGDVTLTAAGVPVAVELVREAGVTVLVRPDPATADAATLVDLIGAVEPPDWVRDAATWFAAQPDAAGAAAGLVAEVVAEHREPIVVMVGLDAVEQVAGEHAVDAARPRLGGQHDGLLLNWLAARSAIDPSTVDPMRLLSGLVDIVATGLDVGGADEVVAGFGDDPDQQLQVLDIVWRLDHPRLPEVLDALGAHHPIKAVAKAARKARMRYRSRTGGA